MSVRTVARKDLADAGRSKALWAVTLVVVLFTAGITAMLGMATDQPVGEVFLRAFQGERENAATVEAIVDAVDVPVQLGGGIRTAEDALSLLDRGVDRVILGTAAVENPDIVREISDRRPGSVVVSLDAKGDEVVVSGWTEGTGLDPVGAAARYDALGAGGILFTDVDVEGRLAGVRAERIARLAGAVGIPVIASGGGATLADVRACREAGAAAVVVGTALYEGAFTLAEAMDA